MIKGRYVIDGDSSSNVLTAAAREAVMFFMAHLQGDWGGSIVVGTGETAATSGDTELEFEYFRVPVRARSVDLVTSEVVLKAVLPTNLAGKIYEVGVYSLSTTDQLQAGFMICDFDKQTYFISSTTANITGSRIGDAAAQVDAEVSTTTTSQVTGIVRNFEANDYQDLFKLAYNPEDENVASIEVRFENANADYFSHTITSPSAGYQVESWTRLDMTNSGDMLWSDDITRITFLVAADGVGATTVILDGLRITGVGEDNESSLISRSVLVTPKEKTGIREMDVEYRIQLNI